MTPREVARLFGVSRSTIYRWLRSGRTDRFEQAGLVASKEGRRWIIKETAMTQQPEWPPHVHRESAEQDGLTPDDFRFDQWPVSNVHLRHIDVTQGEYFPDEIALVYRCDLPPDTPQCNQYDGNDNPLPDPVGMCISSVRFELLDYETGDKLDIDSRASHVDGAVMGLLGPGGEIWNRLTPGASLRVQLTAFVKFFYLNEDGAAMLAYSAISGNRGYFHSEQARSTTYILSMTENGTILIDGEAPPVPEEAPPVLPADWQEGQTFGDYVRVRREAAGKSRMDVGLTIQQPWPTPDGGTTYEPDKWIEFVETDQVKVIDPHVGGLAAELGVEFEPLLNLAKHLGCFET